MSKLLVVAMGIGTMLAVALAQQPEAAPKPATQPARMPDDVKAAQEKIAAWLVNLYGKTEAEVLAELGEPMERGKDRDGDLLLKYSTTGKGTVHLYFGSRQRVVLASYGVTS
jgi:hypothetical protein